MKKANAPRLLPFRAPDPPPTPAPDTCLLQVVVPPSDRPTVVRIEFDGRAALLEQLRVRGLLMG